MMIANEHLNCMQMISCKLTIENNDNRKLWDVTVLHGCMANWQGRCNGVAWIYGQLEGGRCNGVAWIDGQLAGGQSVIDPCYTVTPHKSICWQYRCAFSYMWNLFGVIVLYAAMVNWLGVHLPAVEMCMLLYVKCIWCNGFPCTYGHLRGSIFHQYLCAFSYMWNWFGVMVLHASMVDWWGAICLWYICAFSYMWNLWSVMVLHKYMVNWMRGWGQSAIGMCALCYISQAQKRD